MGMERQYGLEYALFANARGGDRVRSIFQDDRGVSCARKIPAHHQALFLSDFHEVRAEQTEWIAVFSTQKKGYVAVELAQNFGVGGSFRRRCPDCAQTGSPSRRLRTGID